MLEDPHLNNWRLALVHFVAAIIVDTLITVGTALHLHNQKTSIQSYVTLSFFEGRLLTWVLALRI
jgi:hypothetical protein